MAEVVMSENLVQLDNSPSGVPMNLLELVDRLDQATQWLSSWGFNISPTRVAKYKQYLLQAVGKEVSVLEYESIMYDISELFFISNTLSDYQGAALEPLLGDLIKGKVRKGLKVGDERARNFEFELKVIAQYYKLGFELDLSTNADLIVKDKLGSQLLIECKRLTSAKKLGKRIKEAAKQLHSKYQYCSNPLQTRGLIFLDVTNLVNPSFSIIRANASNEARAFLGRKLADFASKNEELWDDLRDLRTWGVVLYCSAPTKINEELSTISRVFHLDLLVSNQIEQDKAHAFIKHFIEPDNNLYSN